MTSRYIAPIEKIIHEAIEIRQAIKAILAIWSSIKAGFSPTNSPSSPAESPERVLKKVFFDLSFLLFAEIRLSNFDSKNSSMATQYFA
jgi:hypothetical protein